MRPHLFRQIVSGSLLVRARRVTTIMVLALVHVVLGGCATTIVPPTHVEQPVTAYIFDYGRHSGLVLPVLETENGGSSTEEYVEYTYGEWGWVAENRAGAVGTARALLVPSQGAFGHRSFHDLPENVAQNEGLAVHSFTVERQAAHELHKRLAHRWKARRDEAVFDERFGQYFVKVDEPYTLMHNCNQVLAKWVRELDCETRGWPILSNWRIRESGSAPDGENSPIR